MFNTDFEVLNLVLPLGISFYTFQALSYIIDVSRGVCAVQKNFLNLALYLMLFPPLISGPIVRYSEMENQITRHLSEHNINYKRSNNDIEIMSINAKETYLKAKGGK